MSKYTATGGESFADVARRTFGDDSKSGNIRRSNPSVLEPISAGTVLFIPDSSSSSSSSGSVPTNTLEVMLDGSRYTGFTQVSFNRTIDTVDSIELLTPFDPDSLKQREVLKPFQYQEIIVYSSGELIFSGVVVGIAPEVTPTSISLVVSAYAYAGVLMDCTVPKSAYPLEFNGLSLSVIANQLCSPFGVGVEFLEGSSELFDSVSIEPDEAIFPFLAKLAKQRNILITSTTSGNLLFWRGGSGGSVVSISTINNPVVGVQAMFQPQHYYSELSGVPATQVGVSGTEVTIQNAALKGVLRPLTFRAEDSTGDARSAVQSKLGRMFGNLVSYAVTLDTWHLPDGTLFQSNQKVSLVAPEAMIYKSYEFTIRSISFVKSGNQEQCTLDLVIPESFTGETPTTMPWD